MSIYNQVNKPVLRRPLEPGQYTSLVYGGYAKQSGIDLSMGSIGDPWDNAVAESFFASLEKELLRRERPGALEPREHQPTLRRCRLRENRDEGRILAGANALD